MTTSSDLHRPTPQSVAAYVKRNTSRVKKTLAGMAHHGPAVSVREADHNGHHILIRTTYEISVDRRPVMGEFLVTDEGQVQCHALPNYTFLSAVDLVKALIDLFPDDFERRAKEGHSMHGMSMPMGRGKPKAGRNSGKARTRDRKKTGSSGRATTRRGSRKGS